jgi:hypothetical protein
MKDEADKDKNSTEYGSDEYLRRAAEVYKEGWGKVSSENPPSLKGPAIFVLAEAALLLGLIYGMGSGYFDKQLKKEAQRAQRQYVVLEKLADLDSDGKLSGIERALMHERLEKDKLHYYDANWGDIQLNSNFWSYSETYRIESAIKRYQADKDKNKTK